MRTDGSDAEDSDSDSVHSTTRQTAGKAIKKGLKSSSKKLPKAVLNKASKSASNSPESNAKAAQKRRAKSVTISDDYSPSLNEGSDETEPQPIIFTSREEALAATKPNDLAITEAAKLYLDPHANEDEGEGEDEADIQSAAKEPEVQADSEAEKIASWEELEQFAAESGSTHSHSQLNAVFEANPTSSEAIT